jgi:hypothetical protein
MHDRNESWLNCKVTGKVNCTNYKDSTIPGTIEGLFRMETSTQHKFMRRE